MTQESIQSRSVADYEIASHLTTYRLYYFRFERIPHNPSRLNSSHTAYAHTSMRLRGVVDSSPAQPGRVNCPPG